MNYEEYHVYIVEGEEQLAALKAFDKERKKAKERRTAWLEAHGGTGDCMLRGDSIAAMLVKDSVTDLPQWKLAKRQDAVPSKLKAWVPITRTKAGKLVSKEMYTLAVPDTFARAKTIGANFCDIQWVDSVGSMCMRRSACYAEGKNQILIHPKVEGNPAPAFPGCRLLKLSEFYALKEDAAVEEKEKVK